MEYAISLGVSEMNTFAPLMGIIKSMKVEYRSMACIEGLLHDICSEIEAQLKPNISGLFGGIVRSNLPQSWVFRTESETVTLHVDRSGNASVLRGILRNSDVTIEWGHELLSITLRTRNRPSVISNPPKVSFQTQKGATAFNFLRGRLGL